MELLENFNKLKAEFESTHIWQMMVETVENSPWHREANVAVHTEMVCQHYIDVFLNDPYMAYGNRGKAIALLTLLFHDTGKPGAKEERYSEERGKYFRFAGHEKISARIWEDYAAAHWSMLVERFNLTADDFYAITWAIENHLPYGLKKKDKIQGLVNTIHAVFGDPEIFNDILVCDCWGRISDDHDEKKANTLAWIEEMDAIEPNIKDLDTDAPKLHVLIGASGSGKSSWSASDDHKVHHEVYSWDSIRIDMVRELGMVDDDPKVQYGIAFDYCTENKAEFNKRMNEEFMKLVKGKHNIVLDNTNLSKKSRAFAINEAKRKGYTVIAHLFPITRDELIARMSNRPDKSVPIGAVMSHYNALSMPFLGSEVDKVEVHLGNLK